MGLLSVLLQFSIQPFIRTRFLVKSAKSKSFETEGLVESLLDLPPSKDGRKKIGLRSLPKEKKNTLEEEK